MFERNSVKIEMINSTNIVKNIDRDLNGILVCKERWFSANWKYRFHTSNKYLDYLDFLLWHEFRFWRLNPKMCPTIFVRIKCM